MINYPSIRPEIFTLGPLKVRWYGLMYVIGYMIAFVMLKARAKAGLVRINYRACESMITYMIIGMLIGARLTYAFVYNWDYYSMHVLDILKIHEGGLSFHGAAIGMVVACMLFSRKYKTTSYEMIDSLAFCAPPSLIFGRIGNFINSELYGRATDLPWGMVFPTDKEQIPRHPSQLYESFAEGVLLTLLIVFLQRYFLKKKIYRHGYIGASFLIGYGVMRFLVEFTREPDAQLGFVFASFSMGQVLCFLMVLAGVGMFWHSKQLSQVFEPKAPKADFLESAS